MANAGFNSSRAYDLSAVAAAAKTPPPPPGASFVMDVDEHNLDAFISMSVKHPVVIELNSPRANASSLSDTLVELTNQAGGAFVLGRVNVDASPQIAQAFGIQAVPMVIGAVAGQLVPLFQGTKSKEDVRLVLDQLLQAAAQAGVVGRAEPVSVADDAGPDPRFAAADDALEAGDYARAVEEFDKLLAQTPSDTQAKAGRAQAGLLARLAAIADPAQALAEADASPTDVDAQLRAADVEMASGKAPEAFARLIGVIAQTSGASRDAVRVRLLDLFETVGNADPVVAKARRDLMTALF